MPVRFPPEQVIAVAFPYIVEFLRRLGRVPVGPSLVATSWYRSPAENQRANGAPDSQHLLGIGIDVDGDEMDLARFRRDCGAVGLVAVDAGSHTHVQLLPAGTARQIGLFELLSTSAASVRTL